jgi:hypothetical protein
MSDMIDAKRKLLQAWDALNEVVIPVGRGKGGSLACAYCRHSNASGQPHPEDCPLGQAHGALMRIIPTFDRREEWLSETGF